MITIDDILAQMQAQLNLSKELEWEVLEEMRAHLEDAVDEATAQGKDETLALLKAAEKLGITESSEALQETHFSTESFEAILLCMVPVVGAIVLRWLVFSAEGTANGWRQINDIGILIPLALIVLIIPAVALQRWRYAMVSWAFFWAISVIFMLFPNVRTW